MLPEVVAGNVHPMLPTPGSTALRSLPAHAFGTRLAIRQSTRGGHDIRVTGGRVNVELILPTEMTLEALAERLAG